MPRRIYDSSQPTPKPHLPSTVAYPTVAPPPHGLVEGDSTFVPFDRPEYRLVVAVRRKVAQSKRNKRLADSSAPVVWVNGDRVYLAESRVHRIPAWPNSDESNDSSRAFRDPPSVWNRLGKVASPAFGKLRRNGSIGLRQKLAKSCIPRFDVNPRYCLGVIRCG